MSLRRGVAAMMANDTATRNTKRFRTSWIYWANMHAHFGDDCEGPIAGNNMDGVRLWQARYTPELQTWCTCQHHNDQFLTWHRMFIYYFEQVLRTAAKDPKLTLPYWDWTTDRQLPLALRAATYVNEQGRTVPNPLRVEGRRASLNSGTSSLATSVVSTTNAMRANTFLLFGSRMEATPHGTVHCTLSAGGCPNGLMGSVATAGMDPVFYFHHANVDRLYQCWLNVAQSSRLPADPAILNRQFYFPDGTGRIVRRRVSDMLTISQLGYRYTSGGGCPTGGAAVASSAPSAAPAAAPMAMAGMEGMDATEDAASGTTASIRLKRGLTEVPIAVERPNASATSRVGSPSAAPVGTVTTATVTIDGVKVIGKPGALYNVYLADNKGRRAQVGVMSFFGFNSPRHHMSRGPGEQFQFDATDAVNTLGLGVTAAPKLIFEPTTGMSDSTPTAATAEIPKNAGVTFRRAKLSLG